MMDDRSSLIAPRRPIAVKHISVIVGADGPCNDCGEMVYVHEIAYRRVGGDYGFICSDCRSKARQHEEGSGPRHALDP